MLIGILTLFQMVCNRSYTNRGSPPPDAQPVAGGEGQTTAAQPTIPVESTATVITGVTDPAIQPSEAQTDRLAVAPPVQFSPELF